MSTTQGYINERYCQTNVMIKTKFNTMTTIQESPIAKTVFGDPVALEQVVGVVESKEHMTGKIVQVL